LRSDARTLIGLTGVPGAGKSTLCECLVDALRADGVSAAHVPMDGFHLAQGELARLGLEDRKGAIETFDGYGYLALIRRLRSERHNVVYAPAFDRRLEEPVAGSIAVELGAQCVLTEGNYLLEAEPPWSQARAELAAVWFLELSDEVRRERLLARHIEHGKTAPAAARWIERVDDVNAAKIAEGIGRADLVVDMDRLQLAGSR